MTQMNGSAIRPRNATSDPFTPNQRLPSTIEALPMFGPGRNWHRPMVSAKSACVSQRRSSTIVRWAHGSTPPKERAPMARKPVKSSLRFCGGVTSIFSPTIHHMLAALAALSLCIAAQAADTERARILSHGPWPPQVSKSDAKRVALGERLFFDPALSGTGSVLCATCHVPYRSFQDGRTLGFGLEQVDRNTPTLLNVALYSRFGWDGGRDSLAKQSIRPLLEPREMRASPAHVASVGRKFGLRGADDEVVAEVGEALAAYQATLISGRTPFDDFRDALQSGDPKAMARYPEAARRGLRIFVAECSSCHAGAVFTNSAVVGGIRDPGLRNVALTAPYMHDGHVASLEEAAAHTGSQGGKDIVEFLRSLTETSQLQ